MNYLPHIGKFPQTEAEWFETLMNLARFLRGPKGCPWDRDRSSRDFVGFAREEAEELVNAIESGSNDHIEEEWGDTFFTLLAAMAAAETEGRFELKHALEKAHEKMVRRHGHIFGEHTATTPEDVVKVWDTIKAKEKEAQSSGESET